MQSEFRVTDECWKEFGKGEFHETSIRIGLALGALVEVVLAFQFLNSHWTCVRQKFVHFTPFFFKRRISFSFRQQWRIESVRV